MKKYYKAKKDSEGKARGKWSDGFSNTKNGNNSKNNKPKKTDDVVFEDGTVMLIDEVAEVTSLTGNVTFFATKKGSLKVNGKRIA